MYMKERKKTITEEKIDKYFNKENLGNLEKGTPFSNRLKELRKRKEKTQKEMSLLCDLSDSTYGTYEQPKYLPDVDTAARLAYHYNVSADYLLGLSDDSYTERNGAIFDTNLSFECKDRIIDIAKDRILTDTFEQMIMNDSFFDLLRYIHAYLIFSGKIDPKVTAEFKELYKKATVLDLSKHQGITKLECGEAIKVSDVYLYRIQEKLKELLNDMSEKNSGYYKKKITRITQDIDEPW